MAEEKKQTEIEIQVPASAVGSSQEQHRLRRDRYQSLYTNNVAVSFSTFDVGITFGEILGEKDGLPVVEEVVRVHMSRELAKALTSLLNQHIKIWESKIGEIKIPDLGQLAPETEADSE